MNSVNYEVKCLACGEDIGQLVDGSFVPGAGRAATRGTGRCSRCGGSLYFEPVDVYPLTVDRAKLLYRITTEAARRPRAS